MGRARKILHSKYTGMLAAALFSGVHVAALFAATFPVGTVGWLFPLTFILPGLLTMILLPGAWRKWYRWLVLVFLCFAVTPDLLATVLFTGQAWALYRSWFLERSVPLKVLFGPRGKAKPAAKGARAAKAEPETVAEVTAAEKSAADSSEAGIENPAPRRPVKPSSKKKTSRATDKSRRAAVQAAKSATVKASE